jgi:hypothetical protein
MSLPSYVNVLVRIMWFAPAYLQIPYVKIVAVAERFVTRKTVRGPRNLQALLRNSTQLGKCVRKQRSLELIDVEDVRSRCDVMGDAQCRKERIFEL